MWPYAITRLTVHFVHGLMSDLVIWSKEMSMVIHDTECPYWVQVWLKQHKTMGLRKATFIDKPPSPHFLSTPGTCLSFPNPGDDHELKRIRDGQYVKVLVTNQHIRPEIQSWWMWNLMYRGNLQTNMYACEFSLYSKSSQSWSPLELAKNDQLGEVVNWANLSLLFPTLNFGPEKWFNLSFIVLLLPSQVVMLGVLLCMGVWKSLMAEWLEQASQWHEMMTITIWRSWVRIPNGSKFVCWYCCPKFY